MTETSESPERDPQDLPDLGFVGKVWSTEPTHVEGEGRHRKLRPLVTVHASGPINIPIGARLEAAEYPQAYELRDIDSGDDGCAYVTVMITAGMGRGRTPAPGTVPQPGETLHFFQVADIVKEILHEAPKESSIRVVTMNQIVAWNVTYWRKQLGLTQEELGERIAPFNGGMPWSKANVSAAERSWDGSRSRRFDIDDVVMFAKVFGVPIPAMLYPPDDHGLGVEYVVGDPDLPVDDSTHWTMQKFFENIGPSRHPKEEGLVGVFGRRVQDIVDRESGEGTYERLVGRGGLSTYAISRSRRVRLEQQIQLIHGLLEDLEATRVELADMDEEAEYVARFRAKHGLAEHPPRAITYSEEVAKRYNAGHSFKRITDVTGFSVREIVHSLVFAGVDVREKDRHIVEEVLADEKGEDL